MVRDTLLEATPREELVALLHEMDPDDLVWLAEAVPEDVRQEVYRSLDERDASWVRSQAGYPEDSVGHLMEPDVLSVRDARTVAELFADLRGPRSAAPPGGSGLRGGRPQRAQGRAPLEALLVQDPAACVADAMRNDVVTFGPEDKARPGGQGLRALRPRHRPRGRRAGQAPGPPHGGRGGGLHPRAVRDAGAPERRPRGRGGPVRAGLGQRAQPLALAGRQPGHRLPGLARHRRLRGDDRADSWPWPRSCPSWPAWAETRATRRWPS